MELQLPSLLLLLPILLLPLLAIVMRSSRRSNLPPGPPRLPIIGSLHYLATDLPHRALAVLARTYGPLMLLRIGQIDLAVVTSREGAEAVMKTHDTNFAYRPEMAAPKIVTYGCTNIVFSPYGVYWRQLRKICVVELLSAKRVKSFSSVRAEETARFLKDIASTAAQQTPVNISLKLMSVANNIVCRATFGKMFKQQSKFLVIVRKAVEMSSGFSLSDLFPSLQFLDVIMMRKIAKIHKEMDAILDETIQDHQENPQKPKKDDKEEEDLLDVLLKAREQKGLEVPVTYENVKAVMLDMFTGGTETSSTIMEWALSELIKSPNIMAKAQQEVREAFKKKGRIEEHDVCELSYLQLVIKETLRLHPPVPLLVPRVCQETCDILGYTIPAETHVVINVWAMGRDPKYWEDPEKFTPERFEGNSMDYKGNNFEFLPFGAGRRICPGISFGMVNIEFGLAQLLFYFDWKLPGDMKIEDLDMTETLGATAPRKVPLHLIAIPRISLSIK